MGVFYAYGHDAPCQVEYHPRLQAGFGLTDGEALERPWSDLTGFVASTRYMIPFNRKFFLSLVFDYIRLKRISEIGKVH